MDTSTIWALVGLTLGFALGEVSRLIRHWVRIGRLKKLICDELVSIRMQIPQKREILGQMIAALDQKRLFPGDSVGIVNTGYHQHISELYEHLTINQRNCLHIIYERLRVADDLMNNFMDSFQAMYRDGIIKDAFIHFKTILNEIDGSYEVVVKLINSYLDRKPIDVFYVKPTKGKK